MIFCFPCIYRIFIRYFFTWYRRPRTWKRRVFLIVKKRFSHIFYKISGCFCFWWRSPLTVSCPRFALQMFTTFAVSNPTPVVNLHSSTENRYLAHLLNYCFCFLSSTVYPSAPDLLPVSFSQPHSHGWAGLPVTVGGNERRPDSRKRRKSIPLRIFSLALIRE